MQQLRASLPARCGTLRSVKRNRCVRTMAAVNVQQLKKAKEQIRDIITGAHCNPILVRLGWHDSGTYSKDAGGWPKAGGATASIRFNPELGHGANAGLAGAIALLEPVKAACPDVSYADLFQLASATAIELAGGPHMAMRYGRKDAPSCEDCTPDGRLPAAAHPFPDGSAGPGDHLRRVFYRMGLDDKDIVVLSGAHTLGRARPERSGFGKESTRYTKDGPGKPGGSSWTVDWLVFNNAYFKEVKDKRDAELLVLETDAVLFEDAGFRPYAEKYAADEAAFFTDYAASHVKLSELGVAWEQGGPVTLD